MSGGLLSISSDPGRLRPAFPGICFLLGSAVCKHPSEAGDQIIRANFSIMTRLAFDVRFRHWAVFGLFRPWVPLARAGARAGITATHILTRALGLRRRAWASATGLGSGAWARRRAWARSRRRAWARARRRARTRSATGSGARSRDGLGVGLGRVGDGLGLGVGAGAGVGLGLGVGAGSGVGDGGWRRAGLRRRRRARW